MFLKKIKEYFVASTILAFSCPDCFSIKELIKYFPDWWSSLDGNKNTLDDERPWICFAAIDFLGSVLTKEMRIYEYGSGGSTLFFAKRVNEVISVEHNPEWFTRVQDRINKKGVTNCHLKLFQAEQDPLYSRNDIANPDAYVADDDNYCGMTFRKYASSIDCYSDGNFDVVLIDGRVRPSCFKHSLNKIKTGGYLILDNAERSHYSYIHENLKKLGWKKNDYFGPLPQVYHFSETCIWQKSEI